MLGKSVEELVIKYQLDFESFMCKYSELKDSEDCYFIDFRGDEEISKGFIPGFIVCDSKYMTKFVPKQSKILFIASPEYEDDAILNLLNNGYYQIEGYLGGGIETWIKNGKQLALMKEISSSLDQNFQTLIDCRDSREWNYGVLNFGSTAFIQLGNLPSDWKNLKKNITYGVVCKRGGRSLAAATYLMSKGLHVVNVEGGIRNQICGGLMKLVKKL